MHIPEGEAGEIPEGNDDACKEFKYASSYKDYNIISAGEDF